MYQPESNAASGRGPIQLICHARMLKIWGSSSRRRLRSTRPNLVMRPTVDLGRKLAAAPHASEVRERAAVGEKRRQALFIQLAKCLMGYGADDEIVAAAVERNEFQAMLAFHLLRRRQRIRDLDVMAELLEPPHEIERAAVAQVRHILLEGQAEDQRRTCLAPALMERVGDPRTHAVVGAAAGKDHLRVVAKLLRQVAEVIWVDANAVPADKPRLKCEKFHFVFAAASTSQMDTSILEKICATSFMKAMLISRCAFSMAFAASAALIDAASKMLPPVTAP